MFMKKIRKIATNKVFLSLIILSFLNLSCNREPLNAPDNSMSGEEMFKEIILFSGKNLDQKIPEYSEITKQLNGMNDKQKAEFEKYRNEIVNNINKIDPGFFDNFKSAVDSKNLYAIQNAINESGDMVLAALAISKDYNVAYEEASKILNKMHAADINTDEKLEQFQGELKIEYQKTIDELKTNYLEKNSTSTPNDSAVAIAIVLVLAVGVVLLLAGAVTHAVAAVIAAVFGGVITKVAVKDVIAQAKGDNQLKNEMIVLSIAENY